MAFGNRDGGPSRRGGGGGKAAGRGRLLPSGIVMAVHSGGGHHQQAAGACDWGAEQHSSRPQHRQGGRHGERGASSLRGPVLALRRAQNAAGAAGAARGLREALLIAEASDETVDGVLLGMAAAQVSRLGLYDLMESLCAYAWCRLPQCGGRDVAELTSAAVKLGCEDKRFFSFVASFCHEHPSAFTCLRDVALVAAPLLHRLPGHGQQSGQNRSNINTNNNNSNNNLGGWEAAEVDGALAFHGLAVASLPHLRSDSKANVRDIAEFLYAFAHALSLSPLSGGEQLCKAQVCSECLAAAAVIVKAQIHRASPQDIAKLVGSVSTAWPLLPQLQQSVLHPFSMDLVQAVRFRHADFNVQDLSLMTIAFTKMNNLDALAAEVLSEQVLQKLPRFTDKDLSLLLWACSRPGWVANLCAKAAVAQVEERDLTQFRVQDLCMTAQALAKLGAPARAQLCFVLGEIFGRQLRGFSTTDKAILLWSLAKSRVMHLGLCRLIVRSLAVDNFRTLTRDVVSAALWGLAVAWPSLAEVNIWPAKLLQGLCSAEPWAGAPPYEVANASWAFGQLPQALLLPSWPSLLAASHALDLPSLSLHELCNLLTGLAAAWGASAPEPAEGVAAARQQVAAVSAEVCLRLRPDADSGKAPEEPSDHDRASLSTLFASTGAFFSSGDGGGNRVAPPAEVKALEAIVVEIAPRRGDGGSGDAAAAAVKGRPEGDEEEGEDDEEREESDEEEEEEDDDDDEPCRDSQPQRRKRWEEPKLKVKQQQPQRQPLRLQPRTKRLEFSTPPSVATPPAADSDGSGCGGGGGMCLGAAAAGDVHPRGRSPCLVDGDEEAARPQAKQSHRDGGGDGGHGAHDDHGVGGASAATPVEGLAAAAGCEFVTMTPSTTASSAGGVLVAPDAPEELVERIRHGKVSCNKTCCPKVFGSRSAADSLMRLNAHCNYSGHCVQLKHTFIHVECSSSLSDVEDDCVLCKLTRPRAKSSDNLDLFRTPSTPEVAPGSPQRGPRSPRNGGGSVGGGSGGGGGAGEEAGGSWPPDFEADEQLLPSAHPESVLDVANAGAAGAAGASGGCGGCGSTAGACASSKGTQWQ